MNAGLNGSRMPAGLVGLALSALAMAEPAEKPVAVEPAAMEPAIAGLAARNQRPLLPGSAAAGADWQGRSWSGTSASWLGVRIVRPSTQVRAQLPDLQPGIGFVVEHVDSDGPAAAAGLQPNDVIWQLNDQWLVNEAQLAALLAIYKPGEVVRVEYYRGGQPLAVDLTLAASRGGPGFVLPPDGSPFVVGPAGVGTPMHIIDVPRREASTEDDDGEAVLSLDQNGYRVKISDPDGKVLHSGPLFDEHGEMRIPEAWRRRVGSLHSRLTEALHRSSGARRPRMRVIPRVRTEE